MIAQSPFGQFPDGRPVELFTLTHGPLTIKVTPYGCRITELHVPDRSGRSGNVVLGFDNLKQYLGPNPYFGSIVGRYANRIARGRFTLDGRAVQVGVNNKPNMLHGGHKGFDKVLWSAEAADTPDGPSLSLDYTSPDGEEGFPGTLKVRNFYTLAPDELRIDYTATTDRITILNLSNHSYFNLAGPASGTIFDHRLTIHATRYTPVNQQLIPSGEIAPVAGTALDFTSERAIGERIKEFPNGYDHNFCVDGAGFRPVARVVEPKTGRVMEILSDQPGVQFYTGGFLDGSLTGLGGKYERFGALALETQHYPDSPNHPNFPSTTLDPGQTFRSRTIYRFSTV